VKDTLAELLLAKVTGTDDPSRLADLRGELQALATLKYDDYEGYSPGVKFIESLAIWLRGFEPEDRLTALDFVRRRLVMLSRAEIDRLVGNVYYDLVRPRLLRETSNALFGERWRIHEAANAPEFASLERRILVLGMSDGARLDKLRRHTPLSTEQFHGSYRVDPDHGAAMKSKLQDALTARELPGEPTFSRVLLVDDFAASGKTMLRQDGEAWDGKLLKIRDVIGGLKDLGVVEKSAAVWVLIYLITDSAYEHLTDSMGRSGLTAAGFELITGHRFSSTFPLSKSNPADVPFIALCEKYYNKAWEDENTKKGGVSFEMGFSGSATPLVLHHNTPNNTPPIIWKDESSDSRFKPAAWFGVFPRHERHHSSRP
jgi:hypothetical protein